MTYRSNSTVLVVPCYNEASRLHGWKDYVSSAEAQERDGLTLLFVDDGSTDTTWDVLGDLQQSQPSCVRRLRLTVNQGKAEAVRQGLRSALNDPSYDSASFLGYWDADLATPLLELGRLQSRLLEHSQLIGACNSRVRLLGNNIQRSPSRHYIGRAFATAASLVTGCPVYDTQCGSKLFRIGPWMRPCLAQPFSSRWIFDIEFLLRIANFFDLPMSDLGRLIVEVPLESWTDVRGSKVKIVDGLIAINDLLRIARKAKH